jgi:hypothetical protein
MQNLCRVSLGESQSGQLRSLLLTQIRSGDHAIR